MNLTGIFAPLTTPLSHDGALCLDRLDANVVRYNSTRLSGYLVLGSSGEAICLAENEKIAVLRAVAAAAKGKVLLAGTGEESLLATLRMTRAAAEMGYHAAVVRTPHYFKPAMTQAAFLRFYTELARQSPIPILPYNIPPLTGVDLSVETTLALSRLPNIVGLKESSGNMDKLVRLMAAAPTAFAALVGGPSTLYPSLCAGARGAILALAAAAPEACWDIYTAFGRGDHGAALEAQRRVLPAAVALSQFGIAGLKAAVEMAGYHAGPPRLPQLPLSADQRGQVEVAFAAVLAAVAR